MDLTIAIAICKRFEGFKSKPYLCPAGIPTIGYGTTFYPDGSRVTLNDIPCTEAQATVWMMHELEAKALPAVLRMCPALKSVNAVNALVSFVYNLGAGRLQTSTLRRKINEGNMEEARKEILKWNRGGGKVLKGLVLRRNCEAVYLVGT